MNEMNDKTVELTREERDILDAFEAGKLKSSPHAALDQFASRGGQVRGSAGGP